MAFSSKYITPDIKLSCYEDKFFKTELAFENHMLVWFISGITKIIMADAEYVFGAGDIFLIPKNQLATVILRPKDEQPNKSVTMLLRVGRLKEFYAGINAKPGGTDKAKILSYKDHPLLKSCLQSLIPYFDMQEDFPEKIASLKITEAINILREIDRDIDSVLANFEEPGKINLVEFMEKNFMFNMPIEKFSYLTGRSLTTFKRDFKKAFNTTPQKWLTRKRLESAHYQLAEKKKKPGEVYYETGFENLSHFSYAFKKQFGYSPTQLMSKQ